MHGERTVMTPERKAKASRTVIGCFSYERTRWLRMPSTPPPAQTAFCLPFASICTNVSWTSDPVLRLELGSLVVIRHHDGDFA